MPLRFQNLTGSVVTWRAHHTAARMRSGATQVKAADRRSIAGAPGYRPQDEHLIEAHLAVEDIAAGESEASREVKRSQHLFVDDQRPEAGRVFLDDVEDAVG